MGPLTESALKLLDGVGDIITIVMGYMIWKLFTNHLPHLEQNISTVSQEVRHLSEVLDKHVADETIDQKLMIKILDDLHTRK